MSAYLITGGAGFLKDPVSITLLSVMAVCAWLAV
jgi:hypothetical protein